MFDDLNIPEIYPLSPPFPLGVLIQVRAIDTHSTSNPLPQAVIYPHPTTPESDSNPSTDPTQWRGTKSDALAKLPILDPHTHTRWAVLVAQGPPRFANHASPVTK